MNVEECANPVSYGGLEHLTIWISVGVLDLPRPMDPDGELQC